MDSERLALQCSALKFLNPLLSTDINSNLQRSDQWRTFSLDHAFWTTFLQQYKARESSLSPMEATTSFTTDLGLVPAHLDHAEMPQYQTNMPPKVSLSIGSNKYVVIKATGESLENELLFVRSASPEECNGPYHANVAEELLRQLKALNLTPTVIGGGRIDYMKIDEISHAHVYGFSYGFGKGDHKLVASYIEANSDTVATFDNSDGLY